MNLLMRSHRCGQIVALALSVPIATLVGCEVPCGQRFGDDSMCQLSDADHVSPKPSRLERRGGSLTLESTAIRPGAKLAVRIEQGSKVARVLESSEPTGATVIGGSMTLNIAAAKVAMLEPGPAKVVLEVNDKASSAPLRIFSAAKFSEVPTQIVGDPTTVTYNSVRVIRDQLFVYRVDEIAGQRFGRIFTHQLQKNRLDVGPAVPYRPEEPWLVVGRDPGGLLESIGSRLLITSSESSESYAYLCSLESPIQCPEKRKVNPPLRGMQVAAWMSTPGTGLVLFSAIGETTLQALQVNDSKFDAGELAVEFTPPLGPLQLLSLAVSDREGSTPSGLIIDYQPDQFNMWRFRTLDYLITEKRLRFNESKSIAQQNAYMTDRPIMWSFGDVDRDGLADMVFVSRDNTKTAQIAPNDASKTPVYTPSNPLLPLPASDMKFPNAQAITVGDVNGDGKPEVIVAADNKNIYIFPNTAD